MPELSSFSYRHRNNGLQMLDARIKLGALAITSIAIAQAGTNGLSIASLVAAATVWKSGIEPKRLLAELRYLAAFLICIWAIRSLATTGEIFAQYGFLKISRPGLISGGLLSWRLLLITIMGLVITATTPPSRIRAAVEWFLKPIPGIPHQTLGTMIGLLVRFIPVILSQAHAIMDAQRARAVENRKNPVYRMVRLGMPLLRHSVVTADRLACAMEARNYSPNRTAQSWKTTSKDVWALIGMGSLCFLMAIV